MTGGPWARGKSFDTSCHPLGPWITVVDHPDVTNLAIRSYRGEGADSSTAHMIWNPFGAGPTQPTR